MLATEHPFLENPFLGPNFEAEDNTLASECIIAYAKQEKSALTKLLEGQHLRMA